MNKINKLISCILTLSFLSANSSFAMESQSTQSNRINNHEYKINNIKLNNLFSKTSEDFKGGNNFFSLSDVDDSLDFDDIDNGHDFHVELLTTSPKFGVYICPFFADQLVETACRILFNVPYHELLDKEKKLDILNCLTCIFYPFDDLYYNLQQNFLKKSKLEYLPSPTNLYNWGYFKTDIHGEKWNKIVSDTELHEACHNIHSINVKKMDYRITTCDHTDENNQCVPTKKIIKSDNPSIIIRQRLLPIICDENDFVQSPLTVNIVNYLRSDIEEYNDNIRALILYSVANYLNIECVILKGGSAKQLYLIPKDYDYSKYGKKLKKYSLNSALRYLEKIKKTKFKSIAI